AVGENSQDFQHYFTNFLGVIDSKAGEIYLDPNDTGERTRRMYVIQTMMKDQYRMNWCIPSELKPLITFEVRPGKHNENMNLMSALISFFNRFNKYVDNNRTLDERERQLGRAEFLFIFIPRFRL